MPTYNKQIKATVSEEQYKKLLDYVKLKETSISQVVRIALKEYLNK